MDHVLELEPRSAEYWCVRGLMKKAAKDRAGARADFERAIELDPKGAKGRIGKQARSEIDDLDEDD